MDEDKKYTNSLISSRIRYSKGIQKVKEQNRLLIEALKETMNVGNKIRYIPSDPLLLLWDSQIVPSNLKLIKDIESYRKSKV